MQRNSTLDFLRFIGFAIVFIGHLFYLMPIKSGSGTFKKTLIWLNNYIAEGANAGVDLFFVLSGFLISGLIFNEYNKYQTFSVKRFLIRRAFKIYPLYYFTLIAFYTLSYFVGLPIQKNLVLGDIFFYGNYLEINNPPISHLWSIAVEEHFYFFIALVFYYLIKKNLLNIKTVVAMFIIFWLTGLIGRAINFSHYKFSDFAWRKTFAQSHLRFDALFTGVILSFVYLYHRKTVVKLITKFNPFLVSISFLIVLLNFSDKQNFEFKAIYLNGLNPICYGIILISAVHYKWFTDNNLLRPFIYLGKHSYALYLVHYPILYFLSSYFQTVYPYYLGSIISTLMLGLILSKLIENPFLKLRDKWYPSRSKALIKVQTKENVQVLQV